MSKYIMRLDDACERMDDEKWSRMEMLLDKYGIRPLVGVIPDVKDSQMSHYETDKGFWDKVGGWKEKGWKFALHGYDHVYITECGGINPVNRRSEFAGVPLEEQKEKIRKGVEILKEHRVVPCAFFAPSHTFDENTLIALKEASDIRIVSDTVANKPYSKYGITFVPQQTGMARKLPFALVTFCYHPNFMNEKQFEQLEDFISTHKTKFVDFPDVITTRKESLYDKFLRKMYFFKNSLRKIGKK